MLTLTYAVVAECCGRACDDTADISELLSIMGTAPKETNMHVWLEEGAALSAFEIKLGN